MQKWIMSGLFFVACGLALVLMLSLPGKEQVAQENKPQMPEVTLSAEHAETVVATSCISCHGDQLEGNGTKSTEDWCRVIRRATLRNHQ